MFDDYISRASSVFISFFLLNNPIIKQLIIETAYKEPCELRIIQEPVRWLSRFALDSQSWGCGFEPRLRQVWFPVLRTETVKTDAPCHSRCGTLKNPHCSMAISAEYRSKFAALHRQLVTSPYKWNNLEWDVKQQINKTKTSGALFTKNLTIKIARRS